MSRSSTSVLLQYGRQGLGLDTQGLNATILRPRYTSGLRDEHAGLVRAVRQPYASRPLKDLIRPGETVAIVIPDITRALPTHRLLPWLFGELRHIPPQDYTIIVGTGTHRANTEAELIRMVGRDVVRSVRIINHDARDRSTMVRAGRSPFGYDVYLNAAYVQADRRILLGFIEPHFMAGFSGGYKAVFPGIADMDAILCYHGYDTIAHPQSTWGILEDNPTQAQVRAGGALVPADFLINVTLNDDQAITGFFCGAVMEAHLAGCAYSKQCAMAQVDAPFPLVVTTNSGYPLDLNLYQSVKGICAAAAITLPGGLIVAAAECGHGFPDHGAFKRQLFRYSSPAAGGRAIRHSAAEADQWQSQKLFQVLERCRVQLFSTLPPEAVRRAHLEPVRDVREAIDREFRRLGNRDGRVAIMPEGPLTIPFLA